MYTHYNTRILLRDTITVLQKGAVTKLQADTCLPAVTSETSSYVSYKAVAW